MLRTKTAIIAFLMVLGMSAAHAAPVILTDVGTQTISGQNFNFNFGALPPSDGTGGTFVLRGVGDYDGSDDETLSWDIEGLTGSPAVGGFCSNGVSAICTSAGGATVNGGQGGVFDSVTLNQPLGNVDWTRTYTIDAATLDSILADSMVDIAIDLDLDVGLFQPPNFVEFTLTYNSGTVPEPATLALMMSGLVGIGFMRRRYNKS